METKTEMKNYQDISIEMLCYGMEMPAEKTVHKRMTLKMTDGSASMISGILQSLPTMHCK